MKQIVPFAALIVGLLASPAPAAQDAQASGSPLVKLLASGRVPEQRQGAVIEMIGKRGAAGDLDYIYGQVMRGGFAPAIRVKALDALAEAALTRDLKPGRARDELVTLFSGSTGPQAPALARSAVRLAGLWKLESAVNALREIARSTKAEEPLRAAAIEALATIGGPAGRSRIEELTGTSSPAAVRIQAVAALARLDVQAAATRAAELIPRAIAEKVDLKPLMAAFLNRQGGGAVLAAAIDRQHIPGDAAKLALRAVYSLGLTDAALVDSLGRAAGITTDVKPPNPAELAALVSEVAAKGDPARGEDVFRRTDLNCMTCHAVSKAGGDVGPDLSSIGLSSPPDYIISSILVPDQSIKEQYHTLVVLTTDGQVYQGIVADKDNQRIVLKEATGALRVVPVATIDDQKEGGSLMPKGLANLMTRAEFLDLVKFLSELGRPGPYAIRTTHTIQRWRVLKEVPPALAEEIPMPDVLRAQVLDVPPDRWATLYAKVAGALPLADASAICRAKVLYLQGELNASAGGTIRIRPLSPVGLRFWVDDVAAPAGTREFTTAVTPGPHTVTLRIELPERQSPEVRIEVDKPKDSTAEFTVVGGK
jgi:putative heme-binding domain-containing protein